MFDKDWPAGLAVCPLTSEAGGVGFNYPAGRIKLAIAATFSFRKRTVTQTQ